ncbi:MAG TPA: Ig-like domain-containing protein, partial [Methanomassiliicoccaceae archaeon]|nr:Ig-like domain-containing protein [Methanomassiliicoccaceae archaeon]
MIISWTVTDVTSGVRMVECSLDGVNWFDAAGATSYTWSDLSDGAHTFHVRATDDAGNVAVTSVTFTVDTVAPELSIISPQDGAYIGSGYVLVEWSATDLGSGVAGYQYRIDGGEWSPITNELSHEFTALSEGLHIVDVRAFDNASNYAEANVTFVIDTIAPELSIISPTDGAFINSSDVKVEWSATDVTSGLKEFMY